MPDIKHRGNKWVLISDEKDSKGKPKKEEEYDTKGAAEKALKRWEGFKEHGKGKSKKDKSYHAKKKSELLTTLVATADLLDQHGFYKEAMEVDELVRKLIKM